MSDIEKMARELMDAECVVDSDRLGRAGVEARMVHRAAIRAIIAALTPPEGYVLVPVQPTARMERAGASVTCTNTEEAWEVWQAMIRVRPEVSGG